MKNKLLLLLLVLIVQLGLATLLYSFGNHAQGTTAGGPLLNFSAGQISDFEIVGAEKDRLTLHLDGKQWRLADLDNLPADNQKVADLLNTLTGISRPWPVARTAASFERFKVADDSFERQLVLKNGTEELARLLIGTPPGLHKVHARLAAEKQIYDIPLTLTRLGDKPGDWLDHDLLKLAAINVTTMTLPHLKLVRQGDHFVVDGQTQGEEYAPEKVASSADKLLELHVNGIYYGTDNPRFDDAASPIVVETTDNQLRSYRFAKVGNGGDAVLQVSGFAPLFKVSAQLEQELLTVDASQLVTEDAASTEGQN